MKPFLLITTRDDDAVVLPEKHSYQQLTGLGDTEMVWHRAERHSLAGINPTAYSGIILAGSPFTVSQPAAAKSPVEQRVELELAALLDTVISADLPFLGICYGVGTLGRHQGGVVNQRYSEPTMATQISLTDAGRTDRLLGQLPARFSAYVGHKEALSEVPEHITVLASSPTCPVQAFRVGQHVYATQFHPELTPELMAGRIRAYANHGYFDPAQMEEIIADISDADVRASHLVLARFVEEYASSPGSEIAVAA